MEPKSYWDLGEKQRAELTEEQVEAFADVELMKAGVLRVAPLVLVEEPPLPEPDVEVYRLNVDHWNSAAPCFATPADALASAAKAVGHVEAERLGAPNQWDAPSVDVLKPYEHDALTARLARTYSPARAAECSVALERGLTARQANEKARTGHKEALEKQQKALAGMWSDWHECRCKAAEAARVLKTLDEYTALTGGDRGMALTFLGKTFNEAQIREASIWATEPW